MSQDLSPDTVRPAPLAVETIRVGVARGPDLGESVELEAAPLRIGTGPDNDFVLSDPTLSPRHCTLLRTDNGVRVLAESAHGVYVGGLCLYDAVLTRSAQLELGRTLLSVQFGHDVEPPAAEARFGALIGAAPAMRELFLALGRLAPSEAGVLLEGEAGTGKQLIAESIHDASLRANGPFIIVECRDPCPELFGSGNELGAFARAATGSLLIEEIGELGMSEQAELLRRLDPRDGDPTANARVIATTRQNLTGLAERGRFSPALLAKFAKSTLRVPPLRERMEDLPLLVQRFALESRPPRNASDIPDQIWARFRTHNWPGNVAELFEATHAALAAPPSALGEVSPPVAASAALPHARPEPLRIARRDAADQFERSYLQTLLRHTRGNVTRAAAIAEVSRQMIQKLLRKHRVS